MSILLCYTINLIVFLIFFNWFNLINLLSFNFLPVLFFLFFKFFTSGVSTFFLMYSSFRFGWIGGRNWWCIVLDVWNSKTFFIPHRQHCSIHGLFFLGGVYSFLFSCMWLYCLRRWRGLMGIEIFLWVPHPVPKAIPLLGFNIRIGNNLDNG